MISHRNLMNLHKKQLILVDHNEESQAVEGLEEAEVLEIIDHHRINALETDSPVYFPTSLWAVPARLSIKCTRKTVWRSIPLQRD